MVPLLLVVKLIFEIYELRMLIAQGLYIDCFKGTLEGVWKRRRKGMRKDMKRKGEQRRMYLPLLFLGGTSSSQPSSSSDSSSSSGMADFLCASIAATMLLLLLLLLLSVALSRGGRDLSWTGFYEKYGEGNKEEVRRLHRLHSHINSYLL